MNTLREKLEKMEVAITELKEAIKMEVKPDLLSGKVAIEVNNEREFKLLMEHYESKGWSEHIKYNHPNFGTTHHIIEYSDGYLRIDESNIIATVQYKIISFSDFAAEVGIKVPVFVMTSEDGADLYSGMEMYGVKFNPSLKIWALNGFHLEGMPFVLTDAKCEPDEDFPYLTCSSRNKAFSTREAAEAWILEANKPKCIEVKLFSRDHNALIYKDQIELYGGGISFIMKPSDLEDMLRAYKTISKS